jgi:hypothetical protein
LNNLFQKFAQRFGCNLPVELPIVNQFLSHDV